MPSDAPPIDAVIYDFGGVFMASPFEAVRRAGTDQGHDGTATLDVVFGPYGDDTDHPWHRCERGELDLMSVRDEVRELGLAQGMQVDLFEMLKYIGGDGNVRSEMIESVRRVRASGRKTGILTNNIAEGRAFWRPMLPLELFDVVVDSSEVGMRKPNPAIYRHTLELLGVEPARSVFLDDYAGNVVAARDVGMIAILVEEDPQPAIDELDALLGGAVEPTGSPG
jgi:epoxide hydrolase-like predicted phosphatase